LKGQEKFLAIPFNRRLLEGEGTYIWDIHYTPWGVFPGMGLKKAYPLNKKIPPPELFQRGMT
jgi:hypothetical protein